MLVKKKFKYLLLALVIFLVVLTLCLRSAVPEKTYHYSEIPASDLKVKIVSYNLAKESDWSIDDFAVDIDNWRKYDENVSSSLSVNDDGTLSLNTTFDHEKASQFTLLSRELNIPVSELPIFNINISVSEGAIYHVRFVGTDSTGVQQQVWWETSPLDDVPGQSQWETHVIDLASFSEQAVGSIVSTITYINVILDSQANYKSDGEQFLCISHIGFSERSLSASEIPGAAQFISTEIPFHAVIIDLPDEYTFDYWSVKWVSVTYTLTSNSEFEYTVVLFSKNGSDLLQVAQGSVFLSHDSAVVDIYRLDASSGLLAYSEELTLLQSLLSNSSIVILKTGVEPDGFQTFKLDSIELMASDERAASVTDLNQVNDLAFGMVITLIAIPLLLLAVAFRFKDYFFKSPIVLFAALFAYGIACRLVVAPFTGHEYDMSVWTQAVRLFYESGVLNIRTFPLPLNCYLLLLTSSPYALLRIVGFQEVGFLAHHFNMLEAVFLKVPFILSDLFSFYFLLKILKKIDGGKLELSGRLYAFVYFLSPLAIVLSSVWGMYDGIAVALFLAGTYYSLFDGKPLYGVVFYTLSGLTKAFGFLGLIPIGLTLLREKKYRQLLITLGIVAGIVVLLYLPLLAVTGLQVAPELFLQFIRGRVGSGSVSSYVPSTSYMSYLSLSGFDVTSPYLTYLLIFSVLCISIYFGLKTRGSQNENYAKLTVGYFIVVFLIFYLLFFRVYEQYYLWIIPLLITYSYLKKESGLALMAVVLSVVVLPVWSFSLFLTGTGYYWIPMNLPVDTAIVAVLPSAVVALSLIGITYSRGKLVILKTWQGMLFSVGLVLWFSFHFIYYIHYGFLPLGIMWYLASAVIIIAAAVVLFKLFKPKPLDSKFA